MNGSSNYCTVVEVGDWTVRQIEPTDISFISKRTRHDFQFPTKHELISNLERIVEEFNIDVPVRELMRQIKNEAPKFRRHSGQFNLHGQSNSHNPHTYFAKFGLRQAQ